MPASEPPDYIDQVLGYVQFPFDRPAIRQELEDHIEDLLSDVPELSEEERPGYIRGRMGDPETVGKALNREHSPVLGWLWKLSKWALILVLVLNLSTLLSIPLVLWETVTYGASWHYSAPSADVIAKVDCQGITGTLDDTSVTIDQLRLHQDGMVEVCYRTYTNPLSGSAGWDFHIPYGCYQTDTGVVFHGGGGMSSTRGPAGYHQYQLDDFPQDAQTLIVDYDRYGRTFYGEIPLVWEDIS